MAVRAALALLRWPGAVTAAGNAVTAFLLAGGRDAAPAAGAALGGALVYSGGVVVNDFVDAKKDRTAHPSRPIPSGRISRPAALRFGLALLAAGCATSALLAGPHAGACSFAAALTALLYDVVAPRLRLVGIAFLAAARCLNAAAGAAAAHGSLFPIVTLGDTPTAAQVYLLGITAYTAVLTWTSTLEDRPVRRAEPWISAALMALAGSLPVAVGHPWPWSADVLLPAACIAFPLLAAARDAVRAGGKIGLVVRGGVFAFLVVDAVWLFELGLVTPAVSIFAAYAAIRLVLARARS